MQNPDKQPLPVYEQLNRNAAEPNAVLKHTAAVLGTVAALGIVSAYATTGDVGNVNAAPITKADPTEHADTSGVKSEQGIYLRDVEELPGYRMKVSKERKKELADSLVTILSRPKASKYGESDWQEVCNANLIKIPGYKGKEIIATVAAHCDPSVTPNLGMNVYLSQPEAVDTLAISDNEFAVADPKEYPLERTHIPIGFVNGMSVNQRGIDIALLRITPNDNRLPGDRSRLIKDIKPVTYRPAVDPIPGQQAVMSTATQASGAHKRNKVGRFLGVYYPEDSFIGNPVAIVANKSSQAEQDPSNFMASGSDAMLADGNLLTATSWRSNSGYPDGSVQEADIYYFDRQSGEWKTYNPAMTRSKIERQLHVDTQRYTTLAAYSLPRKTDIRNLMRGFTHVLQPTPPAEGEPFPDGIGSYK